MINKALRHLTVAAKRQSPVEEDEPEIEVHAIEAEAHVVEPPKRTYHKGLNFNLSPQLHRHEFSSNLVM